MTRLLRLNEENRCALDRAEEIMETSAKWLDEVVPYLDAHPDLEWVTPVDAAVAWLAKDPTRLDGLDEKTIRRKVTQYVGVWMKQAIPTGALTEQICSTDPQQIGSDWLDMPTLQRASKRASSLATKRPNIVPAGPVKDVFGVDGQTVPASEFWGAGWLYVADNPAALDEDQKTITSRIADAMLRDKERGEEPPLPERTKAGGRLRAPMLSLDALGENVVVTDLHGVQQPREDLGMVAERPVLKMQPRESAGINFEVTSHIDHEWAQLVKKGAIGKWRGTSPWRD